MDGREYNVVYTEGGIDKKVLMTRPDGMPAMVPAQLVYDYEKLKGFKMGYDETKERQKQIETRIYNEERTKLLLRKIKAEDKEAERAARERARELLAGEFAEEAEE